MENSGMQRIGKTGGVVFRQSYRGRSGSIHKIL